MMRSLTLIILVFASDVAAAGGLQLPTRGVRPSARGGAFVAGADDLGGLWFNPAGLAHLDSTAEGEKRSFLVDAAYVEQTASYERIDSGRNPRERVENEAGGIPIPSLAGGVVLEGGRGVLGFGIYAPYAALGKYANGGPQRYSLEDMSASALVIAEVAWGLEIADGLRVGVGVQNMFSNLVSQVAFSSCPSEIACAPEDPEFDATGQIQQFDWWSPSAIAGLQFDATSQLTLGVSVQLPFRVSGKGEFDVRLPSSGFFEPASVEGNKAALRFWLPPTIRAGAEFSPSSRIRVEAGVDLEFWAIHDEIAIQPKNVSIVDAPGIGVYELGSMSVPRNFDNTVAVNIGFEVQPAASVPLTVLGGYVYETAASPDAFLSVMTVDGAKHLVSGGLGYAVGKYAIHAFAGLSPSVSRTVTPEEGRSPQLNPIRTDDPLEVFVNWGDYESSWFMAGAGVTGKF